MKRVLKIHPDDNVAVALTDLREGEEVHIAGDILIINDQVPQKHKVSLADIPRESTITMYGIPVAKASKTIPKGEVLTTHNIRPFASETIHPEKRRTTWKKPDVHHWKDLTFSGYHRSDGSVGTRNVWLVVPLVFCENNTVLLLEDIFAEKLGYIRQDVCEFDITSLIERYQQGEGEQSSETPSAQMLGQGPQNTGKIFKNVDNVAFLTHTMGCGGTRKDAQRLCTVLAGYVNNPNVAGATFLSLGCQHAQITMMKQSLDAVDPEMDKPVYFLEQQAFPSHQEFISQAVRMTFAGLMQADRVERAPAPLSSLVLGLECGGSDGFSGISANPTAGYASDILATLGGTPVLSEFPELHGVEQELASRCINRQVAEMFVALMQEYRKKAESAGSTFSENLSFGNIKDGLLTEAMKSAGAALKGGTSPVIKVLDYGEQVQYGGLNLLRTPGNDVESTTGLAASGATLIVFTTGLGTPTGNPVAPVIKVSSNSSLFTQMSDIIDFDAGPVITGEETIESCGTCLFDYIIEVAGGTSITRAEQSRHDDFIPWKLDVSL